MWDGRAPPLTRQGNHGPRVGRRAVSRCDTRADGDSHDPSERPGARSDHGIGRRLRLQTRRVVRRARLVEASGREVRLEFENASDATITIGPSRPSSFVDSSGDVLVARLRANTGDWFLPFKLPAKSKRTVTVALDEDGDPEKLDRIEVPYSGTGEVPRCTIKLSGLAAH